ncbi:hypothetical protein AB1Y20_015345 [Prymnesium parvum]|uniref:PDZ domain-containing protein n=1 Tax=Prymnesium parvum TaxID=97485 RepID=A0AB34JXF9_PRYPA
MASGEPSLTLLARLKRGPAGFGIDVSSDGTIVSVAKGGQAEIDGLVRASDRIVEVAGEPLGGRTLGSMLGGVKPFEAVEIALVRPDGELVRQLQAHGLAVAGVAYRMVKVPVRRGPEGMGIELVGSMVRLLSGSALYDGLLQPRDVITAIDGKPLVRNELAQLLSQERALHIFTVIRKASPEKQSDSAAAAATTAAAAKSHALSIAQQTMSTALEERVASTSPKPRTSGGLSAPSSSSTRPDARRRARGERGTAKGKVETGVEATSWEADCVEEESEEEEGEEESEEEGEEEDEDEEETTASESSADVDSAPEVAAASPSASDARPLVRVQIRIVGEEESAGDSAPKKSSPRAPASDSGAQREPRKGGRSAKQGEKLARVAAPALEQLHFDPLDEEKGTWSDLPDSLPIDPRMAQMVKGPAAYDAETGIWSDVPAAEWYAQALEAKTVGGVSREVLDAMITQALIIEDDKLLRTLVSVQQFGSRSQSFSQVVEMSKKHVAKK